MQFARKFLSNSVCVVFLDVPHLNCKHGRYCETGPTAYSPHTIRLECLTISGCNWKLFLSYFKTLSDGPAGGELTTSSMAARCSTSWATGPHKYGISLIVKSYDWYSLKIETSSKGARGITMSWTENQCLLGCITEMCPSSWALKRALRPLIISACKRLFTSSFIWKGKPCVLRQWNHLLYIISCEFKDNRLPGGKMVKFVYLFTPKTVFIRWACKRFFFVEIRNYSEMRPVVSTIYTLTFLSLLRVKFTDNW